MPTDGDGTGDNGDRSVLANLNRRNLLKSSAGAAPMVWLAGCGGDGDGGESPTDTEMDDDDDDMTATETDMDDDDDGEMLEQIRGTVDNPANLQINDPWGPGSTVQHPSRWGHYLFPPLAYLFSNTRETMPVIASDFDSDGSFVSVTLEEGLTWHNGDDFTTESIKIFWDIETKFLEHNESPTNVADYEQVSDREFRWEMDTPVGTDFAYDPTLDRHYSYHPDVFGDFQERALDTSPGSDAFEQLVTDMGETRIENFNGYGPFEFIDRNASEAVLDKWDGYVHADDIDVDRIRIRAVEDEIAAFQNENTTLIRAGLPAPPDVMDQMPPHHEFGFDRLQGRAFSLNMGWNGETGEWKAGYIGDESDKRRWEPEVKKPTYERPMRHAIAHVIDEEFLTQVQGPTWEPFKVIEGRVFPPDIEAGKLDTSPFYEHYAKAPDLELAEELVNASIDYVYEDGEVIFEPTGEVAQFRILNNEEFGQAIASALDDFGFNGSIAQNMSRMENPVESYRDKTAMPPTVDPTAFEIDWFKDLYAMPPVHKVPEFGEIDLKSNWDELPETYDHVELTNSIPTTRDEEELWGVEGEPGVIPKLTWIWNQNLPARHLMFKRFAGAVNGNRFDLETDERFLGSRMAMHHVDNLGLTTPAE